MERLLAFLRTTPARIVVGALVTLIVLALSQAGLWRSTENSIFDRMVAGSAPKKLALPITLIGIDDATMTEVGAQGALPRRFHAQVLDRLREAGAAVVAFDLVMPTIGGEDDALLATSIKSFGRTVLAADMTFSETASARQWARTDPAANFLEAGARAGFTALRPDADDVLRRLPETGDSFAVQIVRAFDAYRPSIAEIREPRSNLLVRYIGGPRSFTYIPYQSLLDPEKRISPEWRILLRDNIVIVGRNFHTGSEHGGARADALRTPFFTENREFMPRIEAHANIVASMILGSAVREASRYWVLLVGVLAGALSVALMFNQRPQRAAIIAVGLSLGFFGVQYLMFHGFGIWLPTFAVSLIPIIVAVAMGALLLLSNQRQRSQVRSVFGDRVSEKMAAQVMASAAQIGAKPERREITLLVSHLDGLSQAADRMSPEIVSEIATRHYATVLKAVLAQEGTLEGCEGERIVSFWGAPFDDDRQALRAVLATDALREALLLLCKDVSAQHGIELRPRIGVAQGHCMVGNLSGTRDVQYGAIGEAAQIARVLESLCAVYGVDNLIQGSVAAPLQKRISLRAIDTVCGAGIAGNLELYSFCPESSLIEASSPALAAYRGGDFAQAGTLWKKVLDRHPDDAVAKFFATKSERLAGSSAPQWNGVTRIAAYCESV